MRGGADGGPAFPVKIGSDGQGAQTGPSTIWATGVTVGDYFAIHAPLPSQSAMSLLRERDRLRARDDDRFQMRSDDTLEAALRYEFADAMLAAREDKS